MTSAENMVFSEAFIANFSQMGPIEAAFFLSIETLLKSLISAKTDEEVVTSSFLGALIANYPWCANFCDSSLEAFEECSWGQYKKSGDGLGTERNSGADYALVLKRNEDDVRIIVVQAKRGHRNSEGKFFVDVHRRPVEIDGLMHVQMNQLVGTGKALAKAGGCANPEIQSLSFVHYVGYFKDSLVAAPLSGMQEAYYREMKNLPRWYNDVELTSGNSKSFLDVLNNGLLEDRSMLDSWVSVDQNSAEGLLPDLICIMDVYTVEKGKSGRPLTPKLKKKAVDKVIDRRSAAGVKDKVSKVANTKRGSTRRYDGS